MKKKISKSQKSTEILGDMKPTDPSSVVLPQFTLAVHPFHLRIDQFRDSVRIVVATAETVQYTAANGKERTYKMETGRQMAQACHAVSALKLLYVEEATRYTQQPVLQLLTQMIENPITTIVLKARDSKEIFHISSLAGQAGHLSYVFFDDNEAVYGTRDRIPTAVAIGPLMSPQFEGITDYLPLWKDSTTAVG